MHFALSRFSDRIERVAVILEEVSGSRDGLAHTTQIRIEAARLPPLVIEETAVYLSLAIDRVADRAGRALARKLAGEKELARFGRGNALSPEISEIFLE